MRRIMQVLIVTATLLSALGAGWLVSAAGVGSAAAPAAEPTATPTPVHAYYLPLVAHLAGDSSGPITVTRVFAPSGWQAESAGLDYAAVVQGTAYLVTYDQGAPAVGQSATAGDRTYRANKAYLYFDTAAIPTSATVLSATLTAANCRRVAGLPFTVLEAEPEPGGMCRTLKLGDFRIDTGAHRFHARIPSVTALVRELLGEELAAVDVPSVICEGGRFVRFPLAWLEGKDCDRVLPGAPAADR